MPPYNRAEPQLTVYNINNIAIFIYIQDMHSLHHRRYKAKLILNWCETHASKNQRRDSFQLFVVIRSGSDLCRKKYRLCIIWQWTNITSKATWSKVILSSETLAFRFGGSRGCCFASLFCFRL